MSIKYILAVDPGKRNGLAIFQDEKDGLLQCNWAATVEGLIDYLHGAMQRMSLSVIVAEDFIIAPGKNNGSRGEAMQVIGILKFAAKLFDIPLVLQRPELRLHAAKWAGETIPKGHMPDEQSARLHGIYYMRSQGKFTTVLEREKHGV